MKTRSWKPLAMVVLPEVVRAGLAALGREG